MVVVDLEFEKVSEILKSYWAQVLKMMSGEVIWTGGNRNGTAKTVVKKRKDTIREMPLFLIAGETILVRGIMVETLTSRIKAPNLVKIFA